MNGGFPKTVSLQSLLAPVTEETFRSDYWEKACLIVQRNDPAYYGNLFSIADFDAELARHAAQLKTADAKTNKNTFYAKTNATTALEQVLTDMREGRTLILNAVQEYESKLGLLCRRLQQETGYVFQTNLYLTPPQGQGFTPHYDNHDVFILQVEGCKHWKIEKERRKWPDRNENMTEEQGRELRGEIESFTLNQGDLIYIPRGFVHAAECGSEASLHITLGIHPRTWEDLLTAIIKATIRDNQHLSHALPMGFLRGGSDDLVKTIGTTLMKVASDEMRLMAAVEQFNDDLVTKSSLDIAGQVTSFFRPSQVNADDKVGPRAGAIYRLHTNDDSVRICYGGRTIDFPLFLKPSLDFALSTPEYAVKDLAGELEESEKPIVIERLIQEGLVVRH